MTKYEFLERLDLLLTDLPQEERMDAIWYYEDYFADAGPENEELVLRELGSPESVAEKIRSGWKQTGVNSQEQYRREAYREEAYDEQQDRGGQYQEERGRREPYRESPYQPEGTPNWEIHSKNYARPAVVILFLIFIGVPVLMPLIFAVFAVLLTFFLGFGIGGVAMISGGVVLIGMGVSSITISAGIGMLLSGAGLVVAAIGILFVVLAVNCAFRAIPGIIKGCTACIKRLCTGKEARHEAV